LFGVPKQNGAADRMPAARWVEQASRLFPSGVAPEGVAQQETQSV